MIEHAKMGQRALGTECFRVRAFLLAMAQLETSGATAKLVGAENAIHRIVVFGAFGGRVLQSDAKHTASFKVQRGRIHYRR